MAETPLDIDRIVREVVARLGLEPAVEKDGAMPQPQGNGELVITGRVVTLSEVEGRLESVRRLVVPHRAVVTPAVQDELQRKNVTLTYASPTAGREEVGIRLALTTAGKRIDRTWLVRELGKESIRVEPHEFDCLIEATDRLAAEVIRPDTLGLLLSRHAAVGLCLANRHAGVRAVSGADAGAVSDAVDEVGANVLVIDPTAGSLLQLKHIVTGFCRGGIRPCPEALEERLT